MPEPPAKFVYSARVRYAECDPQNVAHHSAYPVWMESARVELLRKQGYAYRELEEQGILFVVARLNIRYRRPALYDDVLQVHVWVTSDRNSRVKVDHAYEVCRGDELLATAETTIVCLNRDGSLRAVPDGVLDAVGGRATG